MLQVYSRLASWLLSIIELGLILPALVLILFGKRNRPARVLVRIEQWGAKLARHRTMSVICVALATLIIRPALIPILGIPQPQVHDEFSYVLAGDTFAHGRLTNPTHPMWTHFETFHVIQQPTYMSQYPPAQGLVLAIGQLLGHPWVGQLLITAAMCGAITWMLQAWLPPGWALLGGALAWLRLGIFSYWLNGYWSGSVVALGGALLMGAWPRVRKRLRVRDAIMMAIGVAILANSRPYEGLIFSFPFAVALLWSLGGRSRATLKLALARVVLPMFLLLSVTAGAMGYYYYRVTGDPVKFTYEVETATYGAPPFFLWQKGLSRPQYRHAVMREFYDWTWDYFNEARSPIGFLRRTADKLGMWWRFYLGAALALPMLAFPWIVRDKKMRFPLLTGAVFVLSLAVETGTLPHYFAPATALLYLVLLQCMRHLRLCNWRNERVGPELVRLIPVICVAMVIVRLVAIETHVSIEEGWPRGNWMRVTAIQRLRRQPGQKLVLVRYGREHSPHNEFVYNEADIDNSEIVWARDMGPQQNEELLDYFSTRSVWLFTPDDKPPHLVPYTEKLPGTDQSNGVVVQGHSYPSP